MKEKILQTLKKKNQSFQRVFSIKCNLLPNDSKLPENQTYITEKKLKSLDIEDENIN